MERWQSIELLNATHVFPCAISVKVIGKHSDEFVSSVVSIVRAETTVHCDPPYTFRTTPGGRHVAITFEPMLESAEHLLRIYDLLRDVEGVVMTL